MLLKMRKIRFWLRKEQKQENNPEKTDHISSAKSICHHQWNSFFPAASTTEFTLSSWANFYELAYEIWEQNWQHYKGWESCRKIHPRFPEADVSFMYSEQDQRRSWRGKLIRDENTFQTSWHERIMTWTRPRNKWK